MKRILVPTDFSETSLKAVRYAVRFAEQYGATIHLVYVIEPPGIASNSPTYGFVIDPAEERAGWKERLLCVATAEIEELVPVDTTVCTGGASREICRLARESNADLVIISTHGRTGVSRALLGSTAEGVVRHAPCPVLVVREHERELF
jgi:nucleotide-binding universal stress UspA family protein